VNLSLSHNSISPISIPLMSSSGSSEGTLEAPPLRDRF
jgi:hypothetical protein